MPVRESGGRAWTWIVSNKHAISICQGKLLRRWAEFSVLPKVPCAGTSTFMV